MRIQISRELLMLILWACVIEHNLFVDLTDYIIIIIIIVIVIVIVIVIIIIIMYKINLLL